MARDASDDGKDAKEFAVRRAPPDGAPKKERWAKARPADPARADAIAASVHTPPDIDVTGADTSERSEREIAAIEAAALAALAVDAPDGAAEEDDPAELDLDADGENEGGFDAEAAEDPDADDGP